MTAAHQPVLLDQAIDALAVRQGGFYIDATYGRGGHSRLLLSRLGESGRLLALDRDPEAIAAARELELQDSRFLAVHRPFGELAAAVEEKDLSGPVDGVLFDLGVSSPQLDRGERGFSFQHDGPLDMRMDPNSGESAAQWLSRAPEKEIADVLYQYGEERHSRRIARRLVEARGQAPIETTGQLAELIKVAHPAWERDRHPATKSFQAIRIKINDELEQVATALEAATRLLVAGGRLAVISFHSLEDRLVKKYIAEQARGDKFPRGLPVRQDQLQPKLKKVGGAIRPPASEVSANPRARSAVLRVAEKISD
jgi:16S rRNA (cytosine1402-N4)-methyltransferase